MEYYVTIPLQKEVKEKLRAGDIIYLTGIVYAARDAAHKRMQEAIDKKEEIPFPIKDSILYYMGPSPAREGCVIGSAGPTTSGRMDKYTPELLERGVCATIGKGRRTQAVKDSMKKNQAIYLAAVGGAGALLSKAITKSEIIAYEDLGTEAIRELYVSNFPAIVIYDTQGNDLYDDTEKSVRI